MKRLAYILVLGLVLMAQPVQADTITFYGVLESGAEVTGSFATDGSSAIFYLPDHWEPVNVWPGCDLCISNPPRMSGGYVDYYFASWHADPFGYRFGHSISLSFAAPDYVTGVRRFTGGVWSNFYSGSSHFFISGLTSPDRWSPPQPAVPEPASLLLFGAGLVGLRAWRRRGQ